MDIINDEAVSPRDAEQTRDFTNASSPTTFHVEYHKDPRPELAPENPLVFKTASEAVQFPEKLEEYSTVKEEPDTWEPLPLRAAVECFYKKHNPEKIGTIETILMRYEGNETQLVLHLIEKYNAIDIEDLQLFNGSLNAEALLEITAKQIELSKKSTTAEQVEQSTPTKSAGSSTLSSAISGVSFLSGVASSWSLGSTSSTISNGGTNTSGIAALSSSIDASMTSSSSSSSLFAPSAALTRKGGAIGSSSGGIGSTGIASSLSSSTATGIAGTGISSSDELLFTNRINQLQSEVNSMDIEKTQLQGTIKSLKTQIANLKKDNTKLTADLGRASQRQETLQKNLLQALEKDAKSQKDSIAYFEQLKIIEQNRMELQEKLELESRLRHNKHAQLLETIQLNHRLAAQLRFLVARSYEVPDLPSNYITTPATTTAGIAASFSLSSSSSGHHRRSSSSMSGSEITSTAAAAAAMGTLLPPLPPHTTVTGTITGTITGNTVHSTRRGNSPHSSPTITSGKHLRSKNGSAEIVIDLLPKSAAETTLQSVENDTKSVEKSAENEAARLSAGDEVVPSSIEGVIAALQSSKSDAVEACEDDKASDEKDVHELRRDVLSLRRQINTLETSYEASRVELRLALRQCSAAEQRVCEQQSTIQSLQSQLMSSTHELETASGSADSLRKQISESHNELSRHKMLLAMADRRILDKDNEINELTEELAAIRESLLASETAKDDLVQLCNEYARESERNAMEYLRSLTERTMFEREEAVTRLAGVRELEKDVRSSIALETSKEVQRLREELFKCRRSETQKEREALFLQKQLSEAAGKISNLALELKDKDHLLQRIAGTKTATTIGAEGVGMSNGSSNGSNSNSSSGSNIQAHGGGRRRS